MSWSQKDLTPPLPSEISDIANQISSTTGVVIPILDLTSKLVETASVLFSPGIDPFGNIMTTIVQNIESLINDLFGTGAFELVIEPTNTFGRGIRRDQFGLAQANPRDVINLAIRSFDDQGDSNRPQFSRFAQVSSFGLLVSSPDILSFRNILQKLKLIWNIPKIDEIDFTIDRSVNSASFIDSLGADWDSFRFNEVETFKNIQNELLKSLQIANGYAGITDNTIQNLILVIARKLDQIKNLAIDLKALVDDIQSAGGLNGAYVFDLPLGVGGNDRIKNELVSDELLRLSSNKYTFLSLYVGGGPTAVGVDKIRQLIV